MGIKYTDKYTTKNIVIILSILLFAYIYCFVYAPSIENDNSLTITKIHKSCPINCKSEKCKTHFKNTRGDKYFISIPENEQTYIKNCAVTFWGLTHFFMYFIITFLVPSFYIEFFFLGIGFEIYEYYKFKCHDINDIYFNTLGILLGKYFSPYKNIN